MILPPNEGLDAPGSRDPFFVTKVKKQVFKPNKICVGKDVSGEEIWVTIKNKKGIERSDKLASGEWIKVRFSLDDKSPAKDKYVYKKDLLEAGLEETTILKYKDKFSFLLLARQYFSECQEAIDRSGIYCPDVESFAELFEDSAQKMQEFRTVVVAKKSDVTQLERDQAIHEILRDQAIHAIYRKLETIYYKVEKQGSFPMNEKQFYEILNQPNKFIDPMRAWQNFSDLLFSALEKEFFAAELITRHRGRDFINYFLQNPKQLLEENYYDSLIEDLESVTKDDDGIVSADAQTRLFLVAKTLEYERFYRDQEDYMPEAGIESASDFMLLFNNQSSITLEKLKKESAVTPIFQKLLNKLTLIKIYNNLKQQGLTRLSQEAFVNPALESGISGKDWKQNWQQLLDNLPNMVSNGDVIGFMQNYAVNTNDFIEYIAYHPQQLPIILGEIEGVVNRVGQKEEVVFQKLETFRQRIDYVASFKGLKEFYVEYAKSHSKKNHWNSINEFLEYMEISDMTLKKLNKLQQSGKLESFFNSIKKDFEYFDKLKKLLPDSSITFPRYLVYLATPKEVLGLTFFKATIEALIKAKSADQLSAYLKQAETNWIAAEYKKYNLDAVTDFLFQHPIAEKSSEKDTVSEEPLGPATRWVLNPKTGKREQVVADKLTTAHFVEIITTARNEIEKGNINEITRIFKGTVYLSRTIIINPMSGRVHILLKGKGVPMPRGTGAFKSVTPRVVIGKDNIAKIYADINIKLPKDFKGSIEEWRESIRGEFAHSDDIFDMEEHRSRKTGRPAISAAQEWLTVPDLRPQNIRTFTTKQRIKILIGVIQDLKEKHAGKGPKKGIVHSDIKPDNMGAFKDDDGLHGKTTDLAFARPLGTITKMVDGSPSYYSPQAARECMTGNGHRLLPQRDLWALGMSLYEVLCTATDAKPNSKALPDFNTRIYEESLEQVKAFINKKDYHIHVIIASLVLLANLTQDEVNASIDAMELEGPDSDKLPVEAVNLLKDVIKSLLQVNEHTVGKSNEDCLSDAQDLLERTITDLESVLEYPDEDVKQAKAEDIEEAEDKEISSSVDSVDFDEDDNNLGY